MIEMNHSCELVFIRHTLGGLIRGQNNSVICVILRQAQDGVCGHNPRFSPKIAYLKKIFAFFKKMPKNISTFCSSQTLLSIEGPEQAPNSRISGFVIENSAGAV